MLNITSAKVMRVIRLIIDSDMFRTSSANYSLKRYGQRMLPKKKVLLGGGHTERPASMQGENELAPKVNKSCECLCSSTGRRKSLDEIRQVT